VGFDINDYVLDYGSSTSPPPKKEKAKKKDAAPKEAKKNNTSGNASNETSNATIDLNKIPLEEMTFEQYKMFVELQRIQDRLSATAVAHMINKDKVNDLIVGIWDRGTLNILSETLAINTTKIDVELDKIFETLV